MKLTKKEQVVLKAVKNGRININDCEGMTTRGLRVVLKNLQKKGAIIDYSIDGEVIEVKIEENVASNIDVKIALSKLTIKDKLLLNLIRFCKETNRFLITSNMCYLDEIRRCFIRLNKKGLFEDRILRLTRSSNRVFQFEVIFTDLGKKVWEALLLRSTPQESAVETTSSDSVEANMDEADALRQSWLGKMNGEREPIKKMIAWVIHQSRQAEKAKESVVETKVNEPEVEATASEVVESNSVEEHVEEISEAQQEVLKKIEAREARLEKALAKTPDENEWSFDRRMYINGIRNSIQKLRLKLERVKANENKEKEKKNLELTRKELIEKMPEVLKELQRDLSSTLEESWVKRWEMLKVMPLPKFTEDAQLRYEILNARHMSKDDVINKAKAEAKKIVENLYFRVIEKVGNITSTEGMFLNEASVHEGVAFNGKVIGDKGVANVKSIYAGGYNIQCLHVRVIVK